MHTAPLYAHWHPPESWEREPPARPDLHWTGQPPPPAEASRVLETGSASLRLALTHTEPVTPHLQPMHYPQLVSTTCVSAGIIAIGAVVDDWPDGRAPLQPY